MPGKSRRSGISAVGNINWGTHLCYFYDNELELLGVTLPFIKAGLENNERCIWVVSKPFDKEKAKRAIEKALPEDLNRKTAMQLEIFSFNEWYKHNCAFDLESILISWKNKLEESLNLGFSGLRATANISINQKRDWEAINIYEEKFNEFVSGLEMVALCSYYIRNCRLSDMVDLLKCHHLCVVKQSNELTCLKCLKQKEADLKDTHHLDSGFGLTTAGREEQIKEELQYRLDLKRLILNVFTDFINIPTDEIDDGINKALQKIGEFTASDHCYLFIFADGGLKVEKTYEWCAPGNLPFAQELRGLPVNNFSWSIGKLKGNEIIHVPRVRDLSPEALTEKNIAKKHSISSFVIVPMISNKLLLGFLGFATVAKEKRWKEEEISLLKILGEIFINSLMRKRSEESLRKSESMLRMITNNMNDFIFQINKDGTIKYVSPSYKNLGYTPNGLIGVSLFLLIHPEDREKVKLAVSVIFETKSPEKIEFRFKDNKANYLWVESIGNGLTDEAGRVIGAVLCMRDISERKQDEKNINLTLEKIIEAMGIIVEMRDPFTAGHQQQVSKLAVAIAEEMGLPQDKINGIRLAAAIHDIGKIYVPAEILTKPGKISPIEFSLIKTHPLMGYEILKKIEFPWPIAEMVAQHHERLDGSGYPEGLAGENILFEARIISVADVVEAMASHRPYRPAYGIKDALEEISKNKGLLYDEQVVEACLRLFKRKGFRFKKAKGRVIHER